MQEMLADTIVLDVIHHGKAHGKLVDWTTSIFLPPFPEPNGILPLRTHQ